MHCKESRSERRKSRVEGKMLDSHEDEHHTEVEDKVGAFISCTKCAYCDGPLKEPWICCIGCPQRLNICINCFAMGVEFGTHENNHPYTVVKFDFCIYDDDWTASEELQLMDAIMENGLGNWAGIIQRLRTKSASECEKHFLKCFVEKPQAPLPEFPDDTVVDHGAPIIFKLSDNPPRLPEGSVLFHDMGGYSAARADFNVEFDNFFEMDICQMTTDYHLDIKEEGGSDSEGTDGKDLYTEMNLAVLGVYRNCLKERQWRKRLVRDYGLINIRKWYGMFRRRFERNLSLEFFRPFMRLFPVIIFDKYLESLLYEKQLKSDILKLQEYRKNGLRRLHSIQPYQTMKQRRDQTRSKRHLLQDVLNHIKDETSVQSWLARQVDVDAGGKQTSLVIPQARRVALRLNVEGLPGFEMLNSGERELCSEIRLVPQAYLDFSKILKTECAKHGSLKLAQARSLIKIDVNKTRKLYDFMIYNGIINKEPL